MQSTKSFTKFRHVSNLSTTSLSQTLVELISKIKVFRCFDPTGLFTADQNLRGKHTSIYTRQNPQGTRYGYECPEERDYYPYWHPTDWIDIAVLADKIEDCSYYQKESFNVKPKGKHARRLPVLLTGMQ